MLGNQMSLILLVDASPLLYQVFATIGHLATKTGEKTGTRFGFLRNIRSWKKEVGAEKVVIVYDSMGPVTKAAHFPEYKSNRVWTDKKEEMYGQLPAVKELLKLTSWSQAELEGYEADDILGTLARKFDDKGYEVCIVTADKDMLSAVTPRVTVLLTGHTKDSKGKNKSTRSIYDVRRVVEETGVAPRFFPLKKAIMGDKSDNIKPMVWSWGKAADDGFVNAAIIKLGNLPEAQLLTNFASMVGLSPDGKSKFMVELELRYKLMSLQETPEILLTKGEGDRTKLSAVFEALEFNSLKDSVTDFL